MFTFREISDFVIMSILLENINNSKILNDETNKEILGSVTHETPTNDKSIQLRSSARVSKKLKLVSRNTISLISSERKGKKKFYIIRNF